MKVIGLCGGSGSGKGTVSEMFARYGIVSIDTDAVYHDITSSKTPCTDALSEEFGKKIINSDGSLNRRILADIVFSGDNSEEKRMKLNSISHKFVLDETRRILSENEKKGIAATLVDAPLLYESGFDKECDAVIAVIADKNIRVKRIMKRDGITEAQAVARINAQVSDDCLSERADYVIINSGDLRDTKIAVDGIAKNILNCGEI